MHLNPYIKTLCLCVKKRQSDLIQIKLKPDRNKNRSTNKSNENQGKYIKQSKSLKKNKKIKIFAKCISLSNKSQWRLEKGQGSASNPQGLNRI